MANTDAQAVLAAFLVGLRSWNTPGPHLTAPATTECEPCGIETQTKGGQAFSAAVRTPLGMTLSDNGALGLGSWLCS